MKKIVNGKRYDTETAKRLAESYYDWENRLYRVEEALYQKRTGEFFLYGFGGPATKYAKRVGSNDWSISETIIPLSYKEAQEWVEENANEQYEDIFGTPEESDSKSIVTMSLPNDVIAKIKQLAAIQEVTLSDVVAKLVRDAK